MPHFHKGIHAARHRALRQRSRLFLWNCETHGPCDHITKTGACSICSTGVGQQWGNSEAILFSIEKSARPLHAFRKGYQR